MEENKNLRKTDIIINEQFGGDTRKAIEYILQNSTEEELNDFILEWKGKELDIANKFLGNDIVVEQATLLEKIDSSKPYGKKTLFLTGVLITVILILVFVAKIISGQIGETLTKWILPIAITLISLKLAENFVGFIRITIAKVRYKKLEDKSNEENI